MRQELLQLRHAMKQQDIQVYVIPSGDDHHSEYVHPHYQGREYVSGLLRSEERRVGKECRSRWSPYH